jgi:succinate dehydrogenase/fumarate reductase-like Fe-S protein
MDTSKAPAAAKPNYIAVLYQAGEGCDHTIACGTKMVPLKATTSQEAVAESKRLLAEYCDERSLRAMHIFEVTRSLVVPVDQLYQELEEEAAAEVAAQEEAAARAQFEKLQARFGAGK